MKKTNWHGSATGKEFEDRICDELDKLGIEYIREKVAHSASTAKREKGKFDIYIPVPGICLELKKTSKDNLDFALDPNKQSKIKWHQIAALYRAYFTEGKKAGLLIKYSENKPIFVPIQAFMVWTTETKRKSINREIALEIGREIDHIKELI